MLPALPAKACCSYIRFILSTQQVQKRREASWTNTNKQKSTKTYLEYKLNHLFLCKNRGSTVHLHNLYTRLNSRAWYKYPSNVGISTSLALSCFLLPFLFKLTNPFCKNVMFTDHFIIIQKFMTEHRSTRNILHTQKTATNNKASFMT